MAIRKYIITIQHTQSIHHTNGMVGSWTDWDLLSVFNVMFLGLKVDALNFLDIFGYAGGVSFMSENGDGKRFMNRMSDLSYIN